MYHYSKREKQNCILVLLDQGYSTHFRHSSTPLLTVPMAHKILFLTTAAMSSINSMEVAQGSMQVVMMYLTGVSLLECS